MIGFGGFWGYQNLYLQTVDAIAITGDRSQMSVEIRSDIADEKLTVTCADQFGNVQTGTVENGRTAFSGLLPNTMYTVSLDIDGFHKLAGQTSQVFTTDTTTTILSFTSVAGQEDGSLILSFTVDGQEPEQWSVAYAYEGGETQYKTFTGHSFTVEDLKIGRVYTFQLDAGTDLSLGGDYSLDVMASRLILAENITASSSGSDLTLRWRAPGDILVDSWKVLCYNDAGFNQELTVSETSAYFPNIDPAAGYTIEITAAGMTQAARYSIAPDPINITSLRADESHSGRLEISWDHAGEAPEGGWLVLYSIDGSETAEVVKSGEAKASIAPRIPGATYRFTIQAANGKTVLSNVQEYTTAEAPAFADNNLKAETVTADLVKTPDKAKWSFEDVGEAAFATTFAPGDKISMVLRSTESFYVPGTKVNVLTVIRDAQGNVVPSLLGQQSIGWFSIWDGGDLKSGEVDLPVTPEIPGSYTVSLMVDGMLLGEAPFEIVQ